VTTTEERVVDSLHEAEAHALDAVRTFVDTVGRVVPDVRDDHLRHAIVDAAFIMTRRLAAVSTEVAGKMLAEAADVLPKQKSGSVERS
jgi:hypothetical protein